ncbi:MAG: alpha amylase C-terminal domain-containing protein, partial [Firmicutes bacterium]|nr:alpha amylase C-terminal domain-containing protein [Bacillota bacterium]
IGRMPGDTWRQFAGLRGLALYQMTHTGAKLNFMGNEIAQFIEWRFYEGLEFFLTEKFENHKKHQDFIRDLNHLYKKEQALWKDDTNPASFRWIDADNAGQNIVSYVRSTAKGSSKLICLINFGVFEYDDYRIGVPEAGTYHELINSDSKAYGGNNHINKKSIKAEKKPYHGMPYSVRVKIPSLGGFILKKEK